MYPIVMNKLYSLSYTISNIATVLVARSADEEIDR